MNKIIPWFRKKLNKLNVFEVPVKEGAVFTKGNSRAEPLNDIDPAYEVESGEDVLLSCFENQEDSKQPDSPTLCEITINQCQEEKAFGSIENQKACHIGLNLAGGDFNLPFDEKYIQVFVSSPEIQIQEDIKNVNDKERALTKSVPVLQRDGKERQPFNSLPNLRAFIETDCKENPLKAPSIKFDEIGQESPTKVQILDIKLKNELCVQNVSVEKSLLSPAYEEDFIPEGVFCHDWIGEVLKPLQTSYVFESCFASGSYGSVFKLKHRVTKEEIAAKIVLSRRVRNNEIEIWKTLDHPNILPLIETFQSKDCQVFVSPLMETNLWKVVGVFQLSFQEIQKYLGDAMRGLNYLHSQNVCHFDIKPDNILIDAKGAKLCDFGFIASTNKPTYVSDLGMPQRYRPPEGCYNLGSGTLIPDPKACDLWGFGIMLLELLAYFPLRAVKPGENWNVQVYPMLFKVLQKEEFFKRVRSNFPFLDEVAVNIAFDCVHRFLRKSPHKRMDASVALRHPFFTEKYVVSFKRMPKDFMWKKTKTAISKVKCCLPRKFNALRARV